jgi:hypothetical protein
MLSGLAPIFLPAGGIIPSRASTTVSFPRTRESISGPLAQRVRKDEFPRARE